MQSSEIRVGDVLFMADLEGSREGSAVDAGAVAQSDLEPGHPLRMMQTENELAKGIANEISELLAGTGEPSGLSVLQSRQDRILELLGRLNQIDLHYLRKEQIIFPCLDLHEASGSTRVMLAIHQDVRELLDKAEYSLRRNRWPEAAYAAKRLAQTVLDLIVMEEEVLFPFCRTMFPPMDWAKIKAREAEIGYAWIEVAAGDTQMLKRAFLAGEEDDLTPADLEGLKLETGFLTVEQINRIFAHLPMDVLFINERDEIAFYSQTRDPVFPWNSAIIGRRVQFCYPPKIARVILGILASFKAGEKNTAEIRLRKQDRLRRLRYLAVRDRAEQYMGVLEICCDPVGCDIAEDESVGLE